MWAIALYSAFVLDQSTTICFLLFHVTKLPHKKIQYPVRDLLYEGEPAQSELEKPSTLRCPFGLYNNPRLGTCLR